MKILFYGCKGWIGFQFSEYLKSQCYEVIDGKARVDDDAKVEDEIIQHQPTHVVSFTGRTHGVYKGETINTIDYLEKPGMICENIRDNMYGPLLLSILSKKYGFHYTYLGTGCIFNYDEKHPFEQEKNGFTPSDIPNYFGSSYSIVKGYVDRLFHHTPVLNLRIRMPITAEKNSRNFITKITKYAKICSIKNSMTVLPDFFPVIEDMMKKRIVETVNLTNPGLISHNEILEMYKEIVDPEFHWNNFTQEEQSKILLAERSNNFLDTNYIETHYTIPNIKESVRNILHKYKEEKSIAWVPKKEIQMSRIHEIMLESRKQNQYTNNGPCVSRLESLMRSQLKIDSDKDIVCVANGSVALYAAVAAMEVHARKRLKWATQAFTFPPSAQGALRDVEIVDIDSEGGMDLNLVGKDVDGIIVTNVFGNVVNLEKYQEWAAKHGKILLFDNAATPFSFYNGKNACNYGHAATISFHHTKPIGFGEGGAIIIDSKYSSDLRRMINFGIDNESPEPKWHEYGSNYKMSDIAAAYILQYLDNFETVVQKHKNLYEYASQNLPCNISLFPTKDTNPFVSCLALLMNPEHSFNAEEKLKRAGIYCRKYYTPLKPLTVSIDFYNRILCVPLHKDMNNEDILRIFSHL